MFKLEKPAVSAAQTTLADLASTHVAILSVLNGTIQGDIWVDHRTNPEVAIVVIGDMFFLAGEPKPAEHSLEKIRAIIPDWAYLYCEDNWCPLLDQVWSNKFSLPHPRLRFGFASGIPQPVLIQSPAGFEFVPVDRNLFDRNPGNLDLFRRAVEEWRSPDAFFENAVGVCALHNKQIVSHCLTDSVCGSRCEIGVRTSSKYRRLGLAQAAASATIHACLQRGIADIEWHTHASNKGSIATAKSIGLTELDRYTAYSCRLPAENIGDLDSAYCAELATHFEQASADINWCRFPAAGASVMAGDNQRALDNIRFLLESDWQGQTAWLENFWALQPLQNDPDFQALISSRQK
ncbi:GNAT family N-acetyltransferase [Labrenzia sp. PHM005]|uniref:GNAT family N-acetyltransferase n=1 Tax=Labrenzia sp. PHM005 TaxID=2590016 RepID=UPI00113FEDF5|nr:GNAT family N-acetyltransferase [Labrenzia sp. PHM005]QDG75925.1 GNAT family N-acetyltransferase [Labrenzia sp. PHM005]